MGCNISKRYAISELSFVLGSNLGCQISQHWEILEQKHIGLRKMKRLLSNVETLRHLGILENVGTYQHNTSTYFNSPKTLGKFI